MLVRDKYCLLGRLRLRKKSGKGFKVGNRWKEMGYDSILLLNVESCIADCDLTDFDMRAAVSWSKRSDGN
jgi:hypothetical protein